MPNEIPSRESSEKTETIGTESVSEETSQPFPASTTPPFELPVVIWIAVLLAVVALILVLFCICHLCFLCWGRRRSRMKKKERVRPPDMPLRDEVGPPGDNRSEHNKQGEDHKESESGSEQERLEKERIEKERIGNERIEKEIIENKRI